MKMVKYAVCAALGMALAVGSVFAGGGRQQQSGGDTQSQSGGAQAAKYTVTFAGTEAATTGQSRAMQEMADILNRDGRFEVSVQVAGALSGDTDNLVTQARTGVPLVVPTDPGRLASQFNIPDLNILMAPYVLTDISALDKLPNTALFKEWQTQLEAQGISFVANMYNGFRSFYTTTPVSDVSGLRNLRIRGFGNNIGNALAKYFSFANIGITWGEVFPAIQQKTLDGCEVQVATAYGAALYEVTPYLALTKHYMLQTSFVVSTNLLNQMTADAKAFFLKTISDTAKKYGQIIAGEEDGFYQQFKDKGVTVTEVNIPDWEAAIAPLYTNNDLGFSAGLKDRLFRELGL